MQRSRRFSAVFGLFFDQKIPFLFVLGAIILGIAGNAAFSLIIKAFGGDTTKNLSVILILSSIGLIVIAFLLTMFLSLFVRHGSVGAGEAFLVPRKGIVYTVGKQTNTIVFSLEHQRPDYVGFICSSASEPSLDELCSAGGFDENSRRKRLVNPQDVAEIHAETKLLVNWMMSKQLHTKDVVIDVTGGMTTMSVGAFALAEEFKIDTQYIRSEFDEKNRPIKGTQKGVFVKRYGTGNVGKSK